MIQITFSLSQKIRICDSNLLAKLYKVQVDHPSTRLMGLYFEVADVASSQNLTTLQIEQT